MHCKVVCRIQVRPIRDSRGKVRSPAYLVGAMHLHPSISSEFPRHGRTRTECLSLVEISHGCYGIAVGSLLLELSMPVTSNVVLSHNLLGGEGVLLKQIFPELMKVDVR